MLRIVYLSNVYWSETKFSKQELALALSKKHQVYYINPVWHIFTLLKNIKRLSNITFKKRQLSNNLTIVNVLGILPWHRFKATMKIHQQLIIRTIKKIVNNQFDCLIITNPADFNLPKTFQQKITIWHWTDDYAAYTLRNGKNVVWQQKELARNVDLVLACSSVLAKKAGQINKQTYLFNNACNPDGYNLTDNKILSDLQNIPQPRIGFIGTLNERIDIDKLAKIINDNKHLSFIFVGRDENHLAKKLNFPNAYYFPSQAKIKLGNFFQSIDVGLLPYQDNLFNRSSNPLKIYEFLLFGKPLISFNLGFKKEFGEFIKPIKDISQFSALVRSAIVGNNEQESKKRRQFALANTWTQRAQELELLLNNLNKSGEFKADK